MQKKKRISKPKNVITAKGLPGFLAEIVQNKSKPIKVFGYDIKKIRVFTGTFLKDMFVINDVEKVVQKNFKKLSDLDKAKIVASIKAQQFLDEKN